MRARFELANLLPQRAISSHLAGAVSVGEIRGSQAMPSDKLDSTELDQFEFRCRAENSFCDDPIFAWHTGERECVMCFTAKDELVTAISEVKPYGNWRHGLTSVRRDGHVE